MGVVILLGLAAGAEWAGSLYLWPFGPCLRCSGTGRNAGDNNTLFANIWVAF